MTKAVTLTVTTVDTVLPAAVAFAGFVYSLTSATNEVVSSAVVTELTTTFPTVAAGTYTASVAAVDATGNHIGTPVTVSVTVPADATYPAPAVLVATVA